MEKYDIILKIEFFDSISNDMIIIKDKNIKYIQYPIDTRLREQRLS